MLLLRRRRVDGIARRDLLVAAAAGRALCLLCLRDLLLWGAGLRAARDCRWARAHETRVGGPEPVRPKAIRFSWGRQDRLGGSNQCMLVSSPVLPHARRFGGRLEHGARGEGATVGRRCLQPW